MEKINRKINEWEINLSEWTSQHQTKEIALSKL